MRKEKIYRYLPFIAITALTMLLVSGCGEQEDPFEEYKKLHTPDYTYSFADQYETKEELYKEIIDVSIWGEEKEYQDLSTRLSALAFAEMERQEKDYAKMFDYLIYDLEYDIFNTLYPEELLEGAILSIDCAYDIYDLSCVSDFLKSIGKYEEYQSQIESARNEIYERTRLDNNSYSSTKSYSYEQKEDPYNVYDYSDAEDFYDDNYDDFWDYEEAEDYFDDAWD